MLDQPTMWCSRLAIGPMRDCRVSPRARTRRRSLAVTRLLFLRRVGCPPRCGHDDGRRQLRGKGAGFVGGRAADVLVATVERRCRGEPDWCRTCNCVGRRRQSPDAPVPLREPDHRLGDGPLDRICRQYCGALRRSSWSCAQNPRVGGGRRRSLLVRCWPHLSRITGHAEDDRHEHRLKTSCARRSAQIDSSRFRESSEIAM